MHQKHSNNTDRDIKIIECKSFTNSETHVVNKRKTCIVKNRGLAIFDLAKSFLSGKSDRCHLAALINWYFSIQYFRSTK